MKFFVILSIFIFLSIVSHANECPQILVSVQCALNNKNFQLVKHIGTYVPVKAEYNESNKMVVCSYRTNEWISQYRYTDENQKNIFVNVTNLESLESIVQIIGKYGFKVDHFSEKSTPFSMITFKEQNKRYLADEVFLFSGLESTFENNNFNVKAANKNAISTVIINERYLKTQNAAADTFETGNSCIVSIN